MSRRVDVPPRAVLVDELAAIVPAGPHAGQVARFYRYRIPERYADGGREILAFKVGSLNYRAGRDHHLEAECPTRGSWSYSGRRILEAGDHWQGWRDDVADWQGADQ